MYCLYYTLASILTTIVRAVCTLIHKAEKKRLLSVTGIISALTTLTVI